MRLDKFLHDAGLGSRKDVGRMIRSGRIMVNGIPVRDRAHQVTADEQVLLDNSPIFYQRHRHILLHKPTGLVTAMRDRRHETVMTLLEDVPADLRPVGRLDKDTTGVLLFTTDGQLAHRLASPKHRVEKTYRFRYAGEMPADAGAQVAAGLELSDGKTRPAQLDLPGEQIAVLTLTEGRTHQVKRMCHALGCELLSLERLRIGTVDLGDLPVGVWRDLTTEEAEALYTICGLTEEVT